MNPPKPNDFDRYLPVANIGRIIKNNLPKEVKLSKEAKETFQECVSEFISFITSEASERCLSDKRKTINGEDLIQSLSALGFDHYKNILKVYLDKYRDSQKAIPNNPNSNENNNNNSNNNNINLHSDINRVNKKEESDENKINYPEDNEDDDKNEENFMNKNTAKKLNKNSKKLICFKSYEENSEDEDIEEIVSEDKENEDDNVLENDNIQSNDNFGLRTQNKKNRNKINQEKIGN